MSDVSPADIGPGGEPIAAPSQTSAEAGRNQSASRSIAWSMGGQLATTLASLVSTVVLARLLTPTDFGTYTFAATIYAMVQWLLQAGMGNYILREAEVTQAKINGATAVACGQGIVATLIVLLFAPAAGWFNHFAPIGWVTAAVAIVPFLGAPEAIADALWLRDSRYGRVALLQVTKAAVQSLVAILCQLWGHWGVYALVAGLLAASLTSFVVAVASLIGEYRARPHIDRELMPTLRSFGGRNFLFTLAQILSYRVPDLLLGRLLGVALLGHYSRAANAIDMLVRTSTYAVSRATAPRFYREANAGTPLPEAVRRYADVLLFFVLPAVAGMAALARPVIHLIYGPQWSIAGDALAFLCLVSAFEACRAGGMEVLLLRDRIGLNAWIEFARGIYAILLVILMARWGLQAVLWGKVIEALITSLVYLFVLRRLEAHALPHWPRLFGINALLALAAGAPPALLMAHWGWPGALGFREFAEAIGAGVALWLVVLALLRHPFLLAGIGIARARLRRG